MSEEEIQLNETVGQIHLVLENGSVEERASMLRLLSQYRTAEDYTAIRDSHSLNDDGTNV